MKIQRFILACAFVLTLILCIGSLYAQPGVDTTGHGTTAPINWTSFFGYFLAAVSELIALLPTKYQGVLQALLSFFVKNIGQPKQ